jgi:PKD repeat protein
MKGLIVSLSLLASGAASANGLVFCEWPGGLQNVTNHSAASRAHYVGEPFVLAVTRPADWFIQYNNDPIQNLGFYPAGPVSVIPQVPGNFVLRAFRPAEGYCILSDTVLAMPSVDSIGLSGTLWTASPIAFSASVSNGVDPKTYLWDFGDGRTSTSVAPTYSYITPGAFTVQLTITDANGRQASRQQAVTISDNPNVPGQPGPISAELLQCRNNTAKVAFEWAPAGSQPSNYYLYKIKPTSSSTWTQLWLTRPMRTEPSLYNQHYQIEVSGCISNSAATCGPSRTRVLAAQNCSGGGGVGSGR